jgi:dTDP-4-dehydrorhamnose reductase
MRALITGADGQLAFELQRAVPEGLDVLALDRTGLDITDADVVHRVIAAFRPDVVINSAAYTAVDRAETEPDVAFAVNADGPRNIAHAVAEIGGRMIHISTDFVFDGQASRPYRPDDEPCPISVYGRSKLAGERAVLSTARGAAVVVRTAWLYSAHGANFVKTILRLLGERETIHVVADQVGTPTWALPFARVLWSLVKGPTLHGILHWTDAGVASWYDFAVAIREEAVRIGLCPLSCARVAPVRTTDYSRPAPRPPFSVLDGVDTWVGLGIQPRHWQLELRAMLEELRADATVATADQPSHRD